MASGECSRSSYVQTSVAGDDANVRLTSDSYRVHAGNVRFRLARPPGLGHDGDPDGACFALLVDERDVVVQRLAR